MNSKNPPMNAPSDAGTHQAPQSGPQSLPQENDLASPDNPGLTDPDEALKRIQREGEINKISPTPENNIGPDTTGASQPKAQPVNQGQSLPQSAIPVDNKFDGKTAQFYDPRAAEVAVHKKAVADNGGKKTDI